MGINIGGWVAPLLCGWLAATYGWHYGFGLAGIGMLTGLIVFYRGIKSGVFGDQGLAPDNQVLTQKKMGVSRENWVTILSVLSVPVMALLLASYSPILGGDNIVNLIFKGVGILILAYLGYILYQASADERKKLFVAILITLFMTIFWGFHELSGSVITLFSARNVELTLMSAAQTNSLNSMFIILFAIPISMLWTWLSRRNLNPRTPYKFGMGLLFAGSSFYVLAISGLSANEQGLVPFSYLLLMYFLLSIGELFMSPVGLSKITSLSPKRIVAFMMGVWFLSSAFAFQVVGFIGKKLSVEGDSAAAGGLQTLELYTDGFMLIAQYSLGAGVLVLLFSPLMKRLMGDVH
jgi:POT family proton-dependent oligopeptide transporter